MQAFLIDLALKATVLVTVAAACVAVLHRHSAAARHLVWSLCLMAIAVLPALSVALPGWRVPGVPALTRPAVRFDVETSPALMTDAAADAVLRDPVAILAGAAGDIGREPASSADAAPGWAGVAPDEPRADATEQAGAVSAGPIDVRVRVDWATWLPLIWLGGVVIVLVTVVTGLARTRWLARLPSQPSERVRVAADQAARQLGLARRVRVIVADDQVMPMTWGAFRPVVLLPADVGSWSADRLHAVLMHELAHVKRHDFTTQLVARFAAAICWFHPLVWFGVRQLRVERELACDDLVLAAGSRPSDYAQQLLDIARTLRPRPLTAAATVAMARPSQLTGRLLAVLDDTRARSAVSRGALLGAVAAAVLVVVPVAGASPWGEEAGEVWASPVETEADAVSATRPQAADETPPARTRPEPLKTGVIADWRAHACNWSVGEHSSASTSINDDRARVRIEMGDCRIDVSMDGDVRFNETFTDVASVSRGGRFEIEEREGRDRRRVEVTAGSGGAERRWWVNGSERPYDAEARAWLERTLSVVFRRTALKAQERAEWIMRTRGLQGLLVEIDSLYSDYAAGRYYRIVLSQPNLDAATVRRLVERAGQRIDSDHTLGQILMAVAEHQAVDENVRVAYVAAAQSIESDFTKRQVLSAILKRQGLSSEVAAAMLQQAATLQSDHELVTLLRELIAAHPIEQSMTPTFFRAVNSIDSDFARRQVLIALLEKGAPSVDVLDRTLESAADMDSDHEIGNVLLKVAELYPVDRRLPDSYVRAAQRVDSDFVQRQVWMKLVQREALPAATLAQVLDAAAQMDSDHEQGTLLRAVIETHGVPAGARDAFFRAAGRLDSDFEAGRVLRAVIDKKPVDRATVLAVVRTARSIDSDHQLGQLLMHIVDNVPLDDEVRSAVHGAADSIESDHTRGQVLSKLYPRTSQ